MTTLYEGAFAKLNLTLDVLDKREDGYHDLKSVMQTVSVTDRLGSGLYFPGKILQTAISFLLALGAQSLLFPGHESLPLSPAIITSVLAAVGIIVLFVTIMKKTVAFQRKLVYNK